MTQFDIEQYILACILMKPSLVNELYIDLSCFDDKYHRWLLTYFKRAYDKFGKLDTIVLTSALKTTEEQGKFVSYVTELQDLLVTTGSFYEYQQMLIDYKRDSLIKEELKKFESKDITSDELVESINTINNNSMVIKQANKVSPDEMLSMIRNKENLLEFHKLRAFNEKLHFKKNTINVIGARPSEGKSALALNLFCDLLKSYKCLYFNMEMTEEEVYERMIAIDGGFPMKDIRNPQTDYQDSKIRETASRIYTYKYEVINGSKTVNAIKNKIIREQKDGHVIVFIDYIGYIVGKSGETDRERIGNAVRELNNITKDYNCTIFLIAQINRNGADLPTMQDLKDTGELEQTADTIILIHDENPTDNSDVKKISLVVPKCRSSRRNVKISTIFDKPRQIMKMEDNYAR